MGKDFELTDFVFPSYLISVFICGIYSGISYGREFGSKIVVGPLALHLLEALVLAIPLAVFISLGLLVFHIHVVDGNFGKVGRIVTTILIALVLSLLAIMFSADQGYTKCENCGEIVKFEEDGVLCEECLKDLAHNG